MRQRALGEFAAKIRDGAGPYSTQAATDAAHGYGFVIDIHKRQLRQNGASLFPFGGRHLR